MRPLGVNPNHRLNRGLDHWWKVLPQHGNTGIMRDIVGGWHLTCESSASVGRATPHAGSFGSLEVVDSTTGQAANSTGDLIQGATDYSVCCWAKEVDTADTNYDGLLHISATSGADLQVWWKTTFQNGIAWGYKNADADRNLIPASLLDTSVWHSYVFARANGVGSLWIDGGAIATSSVSTSFADGSQTGITVGNSHSDTYAGSGQIDDIRLYLGRALSASEALEWHQLSQQRYSPLLRWQSPVRVVTGAAPAGRTTKNTDAYPLGVNYGMSFRLPKSTSYT